MTIPESDLNAIMAIMDEAFDPAFGEAWTRRQVEDSLVTGRCQYLLIDENGDPSGHGCKAGFFLSRTAILEEELLLLAVHPQYRRRGLGKILLDKLCTTAQDRGVEKLFLEMRENNSAETLYRSHGFKPIGRRREYYRMTNGERIDAITFGLTI